MPIYKTNFNESLLKKLFFLHITPSILTNIYTVYILTNIYTVYILTNIYTVTF